MPYTNYTPHSGPGPGAPLSQEFIAPEASIGHPLATVWFRPSATIRELLQTGNHDGEIFLAAVVGIYLLIHPEAYSNMAFGASPLTYTVRFGMIGAAIGVASYYVVPTVLMWTGRWLGGQADDFETKCVYAWSLLPTVLAFFLGLPLVFCFSEKYFSDPEHWINTSAWFFQAIQGHKYLDHFASLWSFCILLAGQREVHRIPWWRALVSVFLMMLILAVPTYYLLRLCAWVGGVD